MEQKYQVISTGSFSDGQDSRSVKQNLITALKLSEQQATILCSGRSIILKDNVDSVLAEKYRLAFAKEGLVCRVATSGPVSAPVPASAPSPAPAPAPSPAPAPAPARVANPLPGQQDAALQCPKCGYRSPSRTFFRECPSCGIIVSKYHNQAAQPSAQSPKPSAPAASENAAAAQDAAPANKPGMPVTRAGAPAKRVVPPGTETGIELTARFFPLNPMLYLCYPQIDIDGEIQKAAWRKTNFIPLLPGNYTIRVCVPYPDKPKYALVEKSVTVGEKPPCCFDYSVMPWTSQPGRLTINGVRAVSTAVKARKEDSGESVFTGLLQLFSSGLISIFDESFMLRLVAAMVDTALLCFLFMAVAIGASLGSGIPLNAASKNLYVSGAVLFVALLYFVILESSVWQATLGKKIFALRVTNYDGERISFFQAIARYLARLILLPGTVCIGFLMIAFTERKQGLHDLVSKSLVSK